MFRLIGVRHPDSGEYRFYVKNIDPEIFDAEDIAQLYAARWQVELVFKEMKSHCRLDELPTSKGSGRGSTTAGSVHYLARRSPAAPRSPRTTTSYETTRARSTVAFLVQRGRAEHSRPRDVARDNRQRTRSTTRTDAPARGARPQSIADVPTPTSRSGAGMGMLTAHRCVCPLMADHYLWQCSNMLQRRRLCIARVRVR
jgi:hypothetical protein